MSRFFEIDQAKLSVGSLHSWIAVLKKLDEELLLYRKGDIPDFLPDCLMEEAVGSAEHIALSLRTILEQSAYIDPEKEDLDLSAFADLPVEISFEDEVLRIRTPYTFDRSFVNKRNLTEYLVVALKIYSAEHPSLYHVLQPPLHEIVKRKSSHWNPKRYRDNDNNEIRILSNELFNTLGFSDSARNMVYTSVFQQCAPGDDGVEVLLFSEAKLAAMLGEMQIKEVNNT